MNDLRLPTQDSVTGKGLKTTFFSTASAFIVFSTGLLTVLHNVPGCSDAVLNYLRDNAFQFALLVGVPSGIFSFIWNIFRSKIPNY